MKRHPFATLFGLIALTAISVNANAKSVEEAARDFVAREFARHFGQPIPGIWVIRYEVGTPSVSDRYPSAIAENLVPRETTVYPIRIHWFAKDWGFRRSDFFLFQDSFGTWKYFYTHLGNRLGGIKRSSPLALFIKAASESEAENDALITEEQRRAFEKVKQTVRETEARSAAAYPPKETPLTSMYGEPIAGIPSRGARIATGRASPQPTPVPRAEKVQAQTADADVRNFLKTHLETEQRGDLTALLRTYNTKVAYHDHGSVDQKFIKKDKEAYFSRWPVRQDEIVGEMSVHAQVPNERWSVAFRSKFRRESPARGEWIQGQVDSKYVVGRTEGGLKIFTENGHVLERQKGTIASAKPAPKARPK